MGKADARERGARFLLARPPIERRQAEHHVPEHGQMREERIVLEHQPDGAPLRRHEDLRRGHLAPVEQHAARRRRLDAGGDPQKGCLAAAGMAEQRDDLARLDVEVDVLRPPSTRPKRRVTFSSVSREAIVAAARRRLFKASEGESHGAAYGPSWPARQAVSRDRSQLRQRRRA